ncbi:hypothetical protein D3C72_440360 [compost metagenome]
MEKLKIYSIAGSLKPIAKIKVFGATSTLSGCVPIPKTPIVIGSDTDFDINKSIRPSGKAMASSAYSDEFCNAQKPATKPESELSGLTNLYCKLLFILFVIY